MEKQDRKTRVDKMVEDAGTHLASQFTRRSFLGRVAGVAGASLFGGAVILGEKNTVWADTPPDGCWGTYDVGVCYSPWIVTGSEPSVSGVYVRKGPSWNAPYCYSTSHEEPVLIPTGEPFGRCSNKGGGYSENCPDPNPRVNFNGFVWGYWDYNGSSWEKQGWIPYAVGGVTYSQGNTGWTGWACGPGDCDFDCRDDGHSDTYKRSHCPDYVGCGGGAKPTCTTIGQNKYRLRTVGEEPAWSAVTYYLRYGVLSTTFAWTVPGDRVKRYCDMDHADGNGDYWSCVMSYCCDWIPYGCRGWIRSDNLAYVSPATSCDPDMQCPSPQQY